jgi:hypothetical protein
MDHCKIDPVSESNSFVENGPSAPDENLVLSPAHTERLCKTMNDDNTVRPVMRLPCEHNNLPARKRVADALVC